MYGLHFGIISLSRRLLLHGPIPPSSGCLTPLAPYSPYAPAINPQSPVPTSSLDLHSAGASWSFTTSQLYRSNQRYTKICSFSLFAGNPPPSPLVLRPSPCLPVVAEPSPAWLTACRWTLACLTTHLLLNPCLPDWPPVAEPLSACLPVNKPLPVRPSLA